MKLRGFEWLLSAISGRSGRVQFGIPKLIVGSRSDSVAFLQVFRQVLEVRADDRSKPLFETHQRTEFEVDIL